MNREFFEIKAKYEKMAEDGKSKVVSENYIVSAVSLSDSETVIHKELTPYISGEFLAVSSKYSGIAEIIKSEDGDRYFKCKVVFISLDEEKGVERKSGAIFLVQANNVKEAYDNVGKAFEGSVSEFEIPSVSESNIVDVFLKEIDVDNA